MDVSYPHLLPTGSDWLKSERARTYTQGNLRDLRQKFTWGRGAGDRGVGKEIEGRGGGFFPE